MRSPVWIPAGSPPHFPDPREFDADGLIAGGGDLHPARLVSAYAQGLFPWYDEAPILWWSPDPRAVITPESLHLSRSFKRSLRQTRFRVTCGTALELVMDGCAERSEGTWITYEMKEAYLELGRRGHALSYEVWDGQELVGGLYGVLLGGLFAAESKFHRKTDASKIALTAAVIDLFSRGTQLFDVQFKTEHLASLGVHEVRREEYLQRLSIARQAKLLAPQPQSDLIALVREHIAKAQSL